MIELSPLQIDKIREHTLACYPEEMCGGLTIDDFIPFTNNSEDKLKSFTINSIDLVSYVDKLIAIVHSHCRDIKKQELFDTRTPSIADIKGQKLNNIPWLIVACEGITVTPPLQLPREPSNSYLDRPFIWFINDCYSLVQDYYRFELNIILPDHKAQVDYKDILLYNNLFDEFITEYGFISTTNIDYIKNGDLLLLDNGGQKRNHLGIFHNGKVIHQDMVSVEVPFETFIGRINQVLKYVS